MSNLKKQIIDKLLSNSEKRTTYYWDNKTNTTKSIELDFYPLEEQFDKLEVVIEIAKSDLVEANAMTDPGWFQKCVNSVNEANEAMASFLKQLN